MYCLLNLNDRLILVCYVVSNGRSMSRKQIVYRNAYYPEAFQFLVKSVEELIYNIHILNIWGCISAFNIEPWSKLD